MTTLSGHIGFLGFGHMGEAIAAGMLRQGIVTAEQLLACDPDEARIAAAEALAIKAVSSGEELIKNCDTLLLAVKPQMMEEALAPLFCALRPGLRVISVMAGISIARLQQFFGTEARILRVMPNTPALSGAGAAGLAPGDNCDEADIAFASAIFESVGIVEVLPESLLDGVTALSGSGPAYFFYMTECLIEAAVNRGVPEEVAARLAAQTLFGAGKLLVESGEGPDLLRERVTSKGGTTFAALESMREADFAAVIHNAFEAAEKRSRELGNS
ncbi:MAG: pyrroline-5-carboxylate reductase [Candidatus Hydrogenedens sp.]|jgi:pyrroline-5-carboxylate reductase|nr:pyrroline-5-carboxylate reductase [Candidatus Hydrogenedens sp.]